MFLHDHSLPTSFQLQGVLFTMIMRYFAVDVTGKIQGEKCSGGRDGVLVNDWTISTYVGPRFMA